MAETTEQNSAGYGKRPLWQWVVIYAVIALIAYGLVYYFIITKKTTPGNQNGIYQQPTSVSQTTPTTAVTAKKLTVEGSEFSFTPSKITLKKDAPVQLTFKNTGKYPHNLAISDLGVTTKTIKPGEEDTITFTPSKAGQFTYICTVPGHADKGMTGTLTVE